jgi:hypothetical protein
MADLRHIRTFVEPAKVVEFAVKFRWHTAPRGTAQG